MGLNRGAKLGPYEILDPLGAGGMGEVYKARDTRLDRTVAIKVLPAKLSAHPEARQRFEREARAVSSLNHPHICALYDIGSQDGIDYLVLEYLAGETLSSRLKQGPLPPVVALQYAIEIAGALDRAHRFGVIHRDLKPGNIMLTKSGSKLLDFGLAKVKEAAKSVEADATAALTRDLTHPGAILGTFQYMSPEQLEGRDADARSDIFSFGAVLYEMLTGRKAFEGQSQASLIASILTSDPPSVSSIQSVAPIALDRVVRSCLVKDPEERWQSAADLARELKWIAEAAPQPESARKAAASRAVFLSWIVAAAATLAAIAGFWLYLSKPVSRQPSLRFTIPTEARLASHVRISPDGTKLVFAGQNSEGRIVMWLRLLDKLETRTLPGTDNARYMFWSPDGQHVGFFVWAENKLKRVDLAGGQAQTICDATMGLGADWQADGTIVFAQGSGAAPGIYRVPAGGGTAARIISPPASTILGFPSLLADGRRLLYLTRPSRYVFETRDTSAITLGSLQSNETKPLVATHYSAAFSPPYLLFIRDGVLMAQEIDMASLSARGETLRVSDSIAIDVNHNLGDFSVSKTGTLALNSVLYPTELVWVDRMGKRLSAGIPADKYSHPVLAPNGKQAVFERMDPKTNGSALWKLDADRDEVSLFAADGNLPVFLPDGSAVAYMRTVNGKPVMCRKHVGGAGDEEIFVRAEGNWVASDFTPDGRTLSFINVGPGPDMLGILPLQGKPYWFYTSQFEQAHGKFSPDGKWIAYSSVETGDFDVYVQPFPATGEKWKVSTHGGTQPRWRRDGKEMFYRTPDGKVMVVAVKTAGGFQAGVPQVLFSAPADPLYPNLGISYDVTSDGERFLINAASDGVRRSPITIITNWTATLAR